MIPVLWALLWPPAWVIAMLPLIRRSAAPLLEVTRIWLATAAGCVISGLLPPPHWAEVAVAAGQVLVALAIWWWHRRKRRRALAALGHKARARLAAMATALRERAVPGRTPQPVPQGA